VAGRRRGRKYRVDAPLPLGLSHATPSLARLIEVHWRAQESAFTSLLKKIRAIRETLGSHFRCTGREDRRSEKNTYSVQPFKVKTYVNLTTRIHDKNR
jgi:hypothetical protein